MKPPRTASQRSGHVRTRPDHTRDDIKVLYYFLPWQFGTFEFAVPVSGWQIYSIGPTPLACSRTAPSAGSVCDMCSPELESDTSCEVLGKGVSGADGLECRARLVREWKKEQYVL